MSESFGVKSPLARIFRLRRLLEEVSRVELEKRAQLAARIERARQAERESALRSQHEAFLTIATATERNIPGIADQSAREQWMLADALRGIAERRERQLAPLAKAAARQVELGREEYLLRRKEKQQVETVLRDQAALRRVEQERREQRNLDDWFAMMRIRKHRQRDRKWEIHP